MPPAQTIIFQIGIPNSFNEKNVNFPIFFTYFVYFEILRKGVVYGFYQT